MPVPTVMYTTGSTPTAAPRSPGGSRPRRSASRGPSATRPPTTSETWSVDAYDAVSGELCDAFEDGVSEVFGLACEAELIAFLGIPTVAELAAEALALSEVRTREDGSTFVVFTTTDATEWVKNAVHAAHGEMLLDDFVFTTCREAFSAIAEAGEDADLDEIRAEFADNVDVYSSELIAWLGSHGERMGYCVAAQEEGLVDVDADVAQRIAVGQAIERGQIFDAIVAGLEVQAQ